ncbi:PREDICTED: disrupted in schizophrenia 1 protein-like [Chrysochloris asiatica]|uniref:Disrupted in schizophrenia 1 protein-like n=1 Tax=Chrysochloris asiatica TaxID=185453 RepID=A0A9B0U1G4_CHRAS|nr:PREDICTED: disrupted in schizophrenia 1 protein-like [Chrysochloris asiatica]
MVLFSVYLGSQKCFPRAASLLKKRLTRRPGYMRAAARPGIGFLPTAMDTPVCAQGVVCCEERLHSGSMARHCGLFLDSQTGFSGDQPGLALCFDREPSWIQSRAEPTLPDRLIRPSNPGHLGCQREFSPMDSSEVVDPAHEVVYDKGAKSIWEQVDSNSSSQGNDPQASSSSPSSQDTFMSNFSFIQLSLSCAEEHGEPDNCTPTEETESLHQSSTEVRAKAANHDRPWEDPWLFSQPPHPKATQGVGDCAWVTRSKPRPGRETLSSLDGHSAPSCSLVSGPSGSEGSNVRHDYSWNALLKKYGPALHDCLLSNQKQLKIKSLRLKLQKLQDKAIEDDDYDKAEKLKQRLEDLEKETSTLPFQLPSRQPELISVLKQLGEQVQAALHWATQKHEDFGANNEDTQPVLRTEPKLLKATAQDRLRVSITRRDWLLQEKQQLQKEIEVLQARMSVLEAKDEQLRREIDEQEQLLRWPGCELSTLMSKLPLGELQKMDQALDDTWALASQLLFLAEPPKTIRSLQERMKSLNLCLKEITAKLVFHPSLPQCTVGSHFCTAKDLTEEIWSLASEREGLDELLNKLLVLSSGNIRKLETIKEDYNKLRRELKHHETTYETNVKETTMKYMEMLEEKLHSCKCPLLEKVWEADLEACQLFIQSMQLKEAGDGLSVEDRGLRNDLESAAMSAAMAIPPLPSSEDKKKTPLQADDEWKAQQIPSPHCLVSRQEEESYIVSEELEGKYEAIGKKLLHLEDQLHIAIHSRDEELIQCLRKELQMVKDTLQIMVLQLQPAREAGEKEVPLPS